MVASLFVASRLIFYSVGIRFDSSPLYYYWQYLDVELLRHRLLESLWYQHSQPPLFNLFLGLSLKVFGEQALHFFAFVYFALGLILTFSVFSLLRSQISIRAALLLIILFTIIPSTILYENYLFYTYPVAALLALSAAFIQRLTTKPNRSLAYMLAGTLTMIALTWSAFHLVWLLLIAIAIYMSQRNLRLLLQIMTLPILLSLGLYTKNLILFNNFGPSSWTGMNLSALITPGLDSTQLNALHDEGLFSDISLVGPFRTVEAYFPHLKTIEHSDVPALEQITKSNGERNLNNINIVSVSKQMLHDDLAVITAHPSIYLRHIPTSIFIFAHSPSEYFALASNKGEIDSYERLARHVLYGEFSHSTLRPGDSLSKRLLHGPLFMYLLLPILIGYAGYLIVKGFGRETSLPLLFMALTVVYVTLVGNLLESGENNRFRFAIDPLLLMLGVDLYLTIKRRRDYSSSSRLS
jgi:hypothetical protein